MSDPQHLLHPPLSIPLLQKFANLLDRRQEQLGAQAGVLAEGELQVGDDVIPNDLAKGGEEAGSDCHGGEGRFGALACEDDG